jgi:PAS domain-containing protein
MLLVLAGAPLYDRVTPAAWGWAYWPSRYYVPFLLHILVCFTIGIGLNVGYIRHARTARERRKGTLMLVATLIPIVSGSLTDGVFPVLGIQTWRLGTATATIMVSIFIYAMLRYQFFLLTPEAVAAEVLATIPDAVFLVDTEGRLRHMNASAAAMTGRVPGHIEGMRIGGLVELDPRGWVDPSGPALLEDLGR